MKRIDVIWVLAGPGLWALWFVIAYSLHGIGCTQWAGRSWGTLDFNHLLQWAAWIVALLLHAAMIFGVRRRIARHPELSARHRNVLAWSVWLGAVSTFLNGLPIVFIAPC